MENKAETNFVSQTANKDSIYKALNEANFAFRSDSLSCDYIPLLFILTILKVCTRHDIFM